MNADDTSAMLHETEDGKWVLTVQSNTPEGTVTRQMIWNQEPQHEHLHKALSEFEVIDPAATRLPDTGHTVRRYVLPFGLGSLFLAHDWGPPVWRLPKVKFQASRTRLHAGVGWWLHAFQITWWSPRHVHNVTKEINQ